LVPPPQRAAPLRRAATVRVAEHGGCYGGAWCPGRSVASTSVKFEGFLNHNELSQWIREVIVTMGANLFRYKGVLSIAGMKCKYVFQGVGMLFSGGFVDTEWAAGETRECRFVFIGKNLDLKALEAGFLECKCTEELRFKVGDRVMANIGKGEDGFVEGKILKCWDDGNPYRIELQDGEKTNVWGPVDKEDFVKAFGKGKGPASN